MQPKLALYTLYSAAVRALSRFNNHRRLLRSPLTTVATALVVLSARCWSLCILAARSTMSRVRIALIRLRVHFIKCISRSEPTICAIGTHNLIAVLHFRYIYSNPCGFNCGGVHNSPIHPIVTAAKPGLRHAGSTAMEIRPRLIDDIPSNGVSRRLARQRARGRRQGIKAGFRDVTPSQLVVTAARGALRAVGAKLLAGCTEPR